VGQAKQGSMPCFGSSAAIRFKGRSALTRTHPLPLPCREGGYSAGAATLGWPQRGFSLAISRGIGPLRSIQAA